MNREKRKEGRGGEVDEKDEKDGEFRAIVRRVEEEFLQSFTVILHV